MDDTQENDMCKVYRVRSRFLPWQVEELRNMFQSCPYPDEDMYKSMALKLNLQQGQVYKWFLNHRWKKRKQGILDPISPEVSDSKDYRKIPNENGKGVDENTVQAASNAPDTNDTMDTDVNSDVPDKNDEELDDNTIKATSSGAVQSRTMNL